MKDVLTVFALQALSLFSITALTCCVLVISGMMGICGLMEGASSGCEEIDVCSLCLTTFSPQPAVASMPLCIPWLFQPASNSLYSQRPLTFSGFCSITGVFLVSFQFSSQVRLSYLFEKQQWKDASKRVVYLALATSCSPGVSNSAEAD